MRLYTFEITHVPAESQTYIDFPNGVSRKVQDSSWKPEGWVEYLDEMADIGARWALIAIDEGYKFFWPSEDVLYRSRSSARDKVKIVERWGGQARILEAEVSEFVPVEQANRRRKIDRLYNELNQLQREERKQVGQQLKERA